MKKLLATTALMTALILSTAAVAHEAAHEGGAMCMESALAGLPEADAKKFNDAMHQSHEKIHALWDKMHTLRKDLYSLETADKFDKAAYLAKSKELAKLHEKIHSIMSDSLANAIAGLPQDERTTIADAMKKMHHHHWHHASDQDAESKAPESAEQ